MIIELFDKTEIHSDVDYRKFINKLNSSIQFIKIKGYIRYESPNYHREDIQEIEFSSTINKYHIFKITE